MTYVQEPKVDEIRFKFEQCHTKIKYLFTKGLGYSVRTLNGIPSTYKGKVPETLKSALNEIIIF